MRKLTIGGVVLMALLALAVLGRVQKGTANAPAAPAPPVAAQAPKPSQFEEPQFERDWRTIPASFKGDDFRKIEDALNVRKEEFETTATYERRLKNHQPAEYVVVDTNITPWVKYDADKQVFNINASVALGSSGGPVDGKPRDFRYAMESGRDDRAIWEDFELAVPPDDAKTLKPHLGVLWTCKPYVGSEPLMIRKAQTFDGELAYETWLRVDSVTAIWLFDTRTRAVLKKYRRVKEAIGHAWR